MCERIIGVFLLLPKTINGETRWLSYEYILQRLFDGDGISIYSVWLDISWAIEKPKDK